jgi:hypothetical protein
MDLYIFAKVFNRTVRIQTMVAHPKFHSFVTWELMDSGFQGNDTAMIQWFFNESYWKRNHSSGETRNEKCLFIPSLLHQLRQRLWLKKRILSNKPIEGLGALFD